MADQIKENLPNEHLPLKRACKTLNKGKISDAANSTRVSIERKCKPHES